MNSRVEFLNAKLTEYLDRRTMPRGLADKPQVQTAEMQALIHCLVRYAPRQEFGEWWGRMETTLDENADTRAWPTVGEIKKAAVALRGVQSKHIAEADDIDPLKIIADRMQSGEAVGDGHLYGRLAVDLQERGLVTSDLLRKHRSALYFNLKKVYGEEKAKQMEVDFIARHDRAADSAQSAGRYRAPTYEPKKIPAREYD